ncbi:MAG: hypothetical protein CMM49_05145 [Rhodospirillaceae bacterium]|nr:hypothetical protein [Rhodospirillaceae bacterium]|tara:strand:+ start:5265 stop:6203 length:939 start_codon:yes stop_codon:yes gene_type:complete
MVHKRIMKKEYPFKQISVEQTNICNSKCSMCPREEFYEKPLLSMDMFLFQKIVQDLHDNKLCKSINFGGMGDSSCDKFLIERLKYCKEHTPNLKINLLSNMFSWKERFSNEIIENNLVEDIRFSIFAIGESTSLKIYKNKFQGQKAKKNIMYFLDKNRKHGNPIKTSLYTLLMEENKFEMDLIKDTYWDLVDEFEIWKPHNWGNIYNYREVQKNKRKCFRIENFEVGIKSNGDVSACTMDINHHIKYGNLKEQTLEEIYNSEQYKKIRDLNRSGEIETIDTCNNCSFLNSSESEQLIEYKETDRRIKYKTVA